MADGVNQSVLLWARGKLGQQVGRGQCWDLAHRALRHAGAHTSTTRGKDDNYVWGDPVALKDVIPGDILQLRDHVMLTKIERTVLFEGGGSFRETEEIPARRPHHTAIVEAVGAAGAFTILEQHVKPGGDKVQRHTLATQKSSGPAVTVFRRVKDDTGKLRMAKVIEKVTIAVTGDVWAYRPKAK